jgi:hypothetical protein
MINIKNILGVYKPPGTLPSGWTFDFVRVNTQAIIRHIDPDAKVVFLKREKLSEVPTVRLQGVFAYYFTMDGQIELTDREATEGTHHFELNVEFHNISLASVEFKDDLNELMLMVLWTLIARAVRRFMQRTRRSKINLHPFNFLISKDVPLDSISLLGLEVGLVKALLPRTPEAMQRQIDVMTMGLYVRHSIAMTASVLCLEPEHIARWVQE